VVSARILTPRSVLSGGSYPLVVRSAAGVSSQIRKRLVYNPSSLSSSVPNTLLNPFKIGGKQGALSPCISALDFANAIDETLEDGW